MIRTTATTPAIFPHGVLSLFRLPGLSTKTRAGRVPTTVEIRFGLQRSTLLLYREDKNIRAEEYHSNKKDRSLEFQSEVEKWRTYVGPGRFPSCESHKDLRHLNFI